MEIPVTSLIRPCLFTNSTAETLSPPSNTRTKRFASIAKDASEELRKTFGTDCRLQALRGAALSHWCVGDHELAVDMDEEQRLLAIDRPFDYTYALTISCIFHSLGRNARKMRSFADNAITIARDQGFGFLELNAANFRAIALALEDPGEETLQNCLDAFEEYRQAGNRMGISSMFGTVAELYGKSTFPSGACLMLIEPWTMSSDPASTLRIPTCTGSRASCSRHCAGPKRQKNAWPEPCR